MMIKICDSSIVRPLSIISKNCLQSGSFPNNWKKSNVVPIHKKGDKQLLQNYRPVSLLPICGKILERIIFNPIFEYLEKNSLLWPNQSCFRPFDHINNAKISKANKGIGIVKRLSNTFQETPFQLFTNLS